MKWINGECDVYDSVAATSLLENTGNTQQGFNEVMFWVRTLIVLLMGLTGKNMIQFLWLYTHIMKDWWRFVGGATGPNFMIFILYLHENYLLSPSTVMMAHYVSIIGLACPTWAWKWIVHPDFSLFTLMPLSYLTLIPLSCLIGYSAESKSHNACAQVFSTNWTHSFCKSTHWANCSWSKCLARLLTAPQSS